MACGSTWTRYPTSSHLPHIRLPLSMILRTVSTMLVFRAQLTTWRFLQRPYISVTSWSITPITYTGSSSRGRPTWPWTRSGGRGRLYFQGRLSWAPGSTRRTGPEITLPLGTIWPTRSQPFWTLGCSGFQWLEPTSVASPWIRLKSSAGDGFR